MAALPAHTLLGRTQQGLFGEGKMLVSECCWRGSYSGPEGWPTRPKYARGETHFYL
jgi:hypothetical protein